MFTRNHRLTAPFYAVSPEHLRHARSKRLQRRIHLLQPLARYQHAFAKWILGIIVARLVPFELAPFAAYGGTAYIAHQVFGAAEQVADRIRDWLAAVRATRCHNS